MARCRYTISLLVLCLLLSIAIARAQAPAAVQPTAEPPTGPLQAVTARKIAIQQQLEALKQSNLSKEDQDTARANFEQLLKVLTSLEVALQKRPVFLTQLEGIPQRLRALAAEQQALATQPRHQFPTATEALREDYEARLHALDTEIQELHQQTAAGEIRLAAIARDLEQHAQARGQLERDLLVARSQTPQAGDQWVRGRP
jgi:hypothetical protein